MAGLLARARTAADADEGTSAGWPTMAHTHVVNNGAIYPAVDVARRVRVGLTYRAEALNRELWRRAVLKKMLQETSVAGRALLRRLPVGQAIK
ncbi:uncharacterized protein AMSG_08610 [Thecamonas trahens ATCC 50062]|uniref:Uncharacterized protein n=1 Tax=Thecamonas trahens ATCC 50062 TaxID=461836 RepID=A0A0L0DKI7_THETB|nr:hypothetical protein AMSG_08610 [Thecamonas trahens ATCC 50062]KNC52730.1 hypothetical protein AMSG_08610 [Thecamonas trahens ATCC 50062]|eukprot:XP_013755044.1 hypothetical protein AMSG_08610 [Thecamonas trahens ATCC 50062]